MNVKLIATMLLLAAALTAGCGGLSKRAVDKKYYTLEVRREATAQKPLTDRFVRIRRLEVSPLYDGREFVYKMDNGRVEQDFYHMFYQPPVELLSYDLDRWIADSGVFAGSVTAASIVPEGYTLEGMLNAVYGDYSRGSREAVLEMQFFLISEKQGQTVVDLSRSYEKRAKLESGTPEALIRGLNSCERAIFESLEADLKDYLLTQ